MKQLLLGQYAYQQPIIWMLYRHSWRIPQESSTGLKVTIRLLDTPMLGGLVGGFAFFPQ